MYTTCRSGALCGLSPVAALPARPPAQAPCRSSLAQLAQAAPAPRHFWPGITAAPCSWAKCSTCYFLPDGRPHTQGATWVTFSRHSSLVGPRKRTWHSARSSSRLAAPSKLLSSATPSPASRTGATSSGSARRPSLGFGASPGAACALASTGDQAESPARRSARCPAVLADEVHASVAAAASPRGCGASAQRRLRLAPAAALSHGSPPCSGAQRSTFRSTAHTTDFHCQQKGLSIHVSSLVGDDKMRRALACLCAHAPALPSGLFCL